MTTRTLVALLAILSAFVPAVILLAESDAQEATSSAGSASAAPDAPWWTCARYLPRRLRLGVAGKPAVLTVGATPPLWLST
jgi:hypothetical protein